MKVDLPAEIVFGLAGCGLRRSPGFGVAKDEAFPLGHPLRSNVQQWLGPMHFAPYSRAAATALHRLPVHGVCG